MGSQIKQVEQLLNSGQKALISFLSLTFSNLKKIADERGIQEFGWLKEEEPYEDDYEEYEEYEKDLEVFEKWQLNFIIGEDYVERSRVVTGISYRLTDFSLDCSSVVVSRTHLYLAEKIVPEDSYTIPNPNLYGNYEPLLKLAQLISEELGV